MTTTKVFPQMRGVNSRLAELKAVTSELSLAEKRALLESLSEDVQAAAVDDPKKRLAAVQAAAVSTSPRTKDAFKFAVTGLQKLGLAIDAILCQRRYFLIGQTDEGAGVGAPSGVSG